MDLFVVSTIGFNLLYVLVIIRLARRELIWLNVTAHPTAEWIAQQITEAFPWSEAPRYLILRTSAASSLCDVVKDWADSCVITIRRQPELWEVSSDEFFDYGSSKNSVSDKRRRRRGQR